jgi:toxin-antitoxin system PIN domain toxin
MILPDLNLLVYAYNLGAPDHQRAKQWWEDIMTRQEPVGLPLAIATGFIRLMTNPKVVLPPMPLAKAIAEVKRWLAAPNVSQIHVTPNHWDELEKLGWAGPDVSDAHLAVLAMEHACELQTNDTDFARCPGLRWRNPLEP